MRRVRQRGGKRLHLISGSARLGKKNAALRRAKSLLLTRFPSANRFPLRSKTFAQLPKRDRKPRQPPAWPCAGPACSANSSLTGSSSIPGSSGALKIGIPGGTVAALLLPRSVRARNGGAAVIDGGSVGGGDGAAAAAGAGSATATASGELSGRLSCAATGAAASRTSRGGSTRRGASISSLKAVDSIAAFLSEGNEASGICH